MKDHYTVAELARLKLPGLPPSERNLRDHVKDNGWPSILVKAKGGRGGVCRRYPVSALPDEAREALLSRAVATTAAAVPAVVQDPADLKTWQSQVLEARAVILAEVDRLVTIMGVKPGQAVDALVQAAKEGTLSPALAERARMANARAGREGARTLSRRSMYRWMEAREAAGSTLALAPAAVAEAAIPEWADTFLRFYAKPTKPGIQEALDHRDWPAEVEKPHYDRVRRFLGKMDAVSRNMGRLGPRALRAMRAFKTRDASGFAPGTVFIGDGHTYKAEVAHPVSGRPFRPEVTSILDVSTRKWVGYSVDLAENTWAVADALRHAVTTGTLCDILYYDNGSGAKNKTWDDEATGLAARLSITKLHSAPWSSQARGVIERFHSSVLHRLARTGPTYVGPRMDKEARERAFKVTRKEIKETGTSRLLPTFGDLIADLDAAMLTYNGAPHSSLAKIIDPETGRRRPMSPDEAWAKAIADGWRPEPIPVDEARALFRPAIRRKVHRGRVSWLGNHYSAAALEHLHEEQVMVSYDIHDATAVTVSLLDGRFVCEATWEYHTTSYVPVSMAEKAHRGRVAGQLARNAEHRDAILANAGAGTIAIEHQPAEDVTSAVQAVADAELARMEAIASPRMAANANGRPSFGDDMAWIKWLVDHPDEVDDEDRSLVRKKARTSEFRLLCEMHGINLGGISQAVA